MTAGSAQAPVAPGRMGVAPDPTALLTYLDQLGRWRDARRAELNELDRAALASPTGASATADIALSLALWKAVADRYEQLLRVWDSGRVGATEREKLSSLIWGRLDAAYDSSGLAVSMPEACRLSDALASQLRVRLGLAVSALETTERIAELRAQLERIRDQVGLEPPGARQQQAAETQSKLARRLRDVTEKAGRGGDVGGLLPALEIDAARFERDLIVGAAKRREARIEIEQIRRLRADLETEIGPAAYGWRPSAWRRWIRHRATPSRTWRLSDRCRTPWTRWPSTAVVSAWWTRRSAWPVTPTVPPCDSTPTW